MVNIGPGISDQVTCVCSILFGDADETGNWFALELTTAGCVIVTCRDEAGTSCGELSCFLDLAFFGGVALDMVGLFLVECLVLAWCVFRKKSYCRGGGHAWAHP